MSPTPTGRPSRKATERCCHPSQMRSVQSQMGMSENKLSSAHMLTLLSGFLITYMGSAVGTSPGRLVETDANFNIIAEHPKDIAGLANIAGEQFSPHGLSVDWEKNVMLTSDFVVPITILKPSLGIVHANTLRLWNLASRTIISTITIPDVSFTPVY